MNPLTDPDLYFSEYNPDGTSVFSTEKIRAIVEQYGAESNDVVMGYPSYDCGCFVGCEDFVVDLADEGLTHFKDFCCDDYRPLCIDRESHKTFMVNLSSFGISNLLSSTHENFSLHHKAYLTVLLIRALI